MPNTRGVASWLRSAPWSPALGASLLLWAATYVLAGTGALQTLRVAATLAVFYVIVGIGQMFVIAGGNGQIDLSVSYTMTLSGFVGVAVMNGDNSRTWLAILVAIGLGVGIGLINALAIRLLLIPPIVATLAVGFVVFSAAIVRSRTSAGDTPSPGLQGFTTRNVVGVPVMPLVFIVVAIGAAVLLNRTRYGRSVLAYGQASRAAWLARIRISRTVAGSYAVSGGLGGLGGVLLASYSGGADLDMAGPYLLGSIAVVVLGGTSIFGGQANVTGVWTAALFLTFLGNLVNVAHLGADWQNMVQGLVIIVVLTLFVGKSRRTA